MSRSMRTGFLEEHFASETLLARDGEPHEGADLRRRHLDRSSVFAFYERHNIERYYLSDRFSNPRNIYTTPLASVTTRARKHDNYVIMESYPKRACTPRKLQAVVVVT